MATPRSSCFRGICTTGQAVDQTPLTASGRPIACLFWGWLIFFGRTKKVLIIIMVALIAFSTGFLFSQSDSQSEIDALNTELYDAEASLESAHRDLYKAKDAQKEAEHQRNHAQASDSDVRKTLFQAKRELT